MTNPTPKAIAVDFTPLTEGLEAMFETLFPGGPAEYAAWLEAHSEMEGNGLDPSSDEHYEMMERWFGVDESGETDD